MNCEFFLLSALKFFILMVSKYNIGWILINSSVQKKSVVGPLSPDQWSTVGGLGFCVNHQIMPWNICAGPAVNINWALALNFFTHLIWSGALTLTC